MHRLTLPVSSENSGIRLERKLLGLLSGKPDTEKDTLVGVAVMPRSAGDLQCGAIIDVLNDWKVINLIIGMVFDTTASNTGKYAGCCTTLERESKRALPWLARRHHMLQVHIKHVADHINGARNSPSHALCVRFQKKFKHLDRSIEVEPSSS